MNLLAQLAAHLAHLRSLDIADGDAIEVVAAVAHAGGCPLCGRTDWRPSGDRFVDCSSCGVVCVYRRTSMARHQVSARQLVAAVFRVAVSTDASSARGFARSEGAARSTMWRLLHRSRAALPDIAVTSPVAVVQVLGAEQPANRAFVAFGCDERGVAAAVVPVSAQLTAASALAAAKASTKAPGRPSSATALASGQMRAWLTTTFRGVSAAWLWSYVKEFNARQRRCARVDLHEMGRSARIVLENSADRPTSRKRAA